MATGRVLGVVACLTLAMPATAIGEPPDGWSGWVSIRTLPGFEDVRAQLQALVDTNGRHRINRFCIIGEKGPGYLHAEVYWPVVNKLILWRPNIDDQNTLAHSNNGGPPMAKPAAATPLPETVGLDPPNTDAGAMERLFLLEAYSPGNIGSYIAAQNLAAMPVWRKPGCRV